MSHLKEKEKKVIALTWWWTWGHIFPLLSTYNYFRDKDEKEEDLYDFEFLWVWEEESLEEEIAIKNKIKFLDIPAWKIRRYFDIRNFYEPLKNLTWIAFWIYYISKYKIDIVFSKWWYVALPLCIAAFIMRKNIYIHESDTVSWVANKIIWKIANKVFYTFPNEKIIENPSKHVLTWQILNPELLDYIEDLEIEQNEKLSIIVIAWSQWSTKIFEALLKILPDFPDIDFQVILWEKNMHFREKFKKFPNIMAHDFVTQKRLWKIFKQVDISITRWGATTLWELNLFWIHSIIVPLSSSAWNHQNKNALFFNKNFSYDIVNEENEFEINLYRTIKKYKNFRKTALNLRWFFNPLQIIEEELNNNI